MKPYHFYDLADAEVLRSLGSMEGEPSLSEQQALPEGQARWPGVLVAVGVTLAAWGLLQLPFPPFTLDSGAHPLGLSVLSMIAGMAAASLLRIPENWTAGLRWSANVLIPIAIVLLGSKIDTRLLSQMSPSLWFGIPVLMTLTIAGTCLLGRLCGLHWRIAALLAVGTAVCGSSAILAVAPILIAKNDEMILSVSAINLTGIIAMIGSIAILAIMPMDSALFGYWTGASIQAVPQAIAVAETHGTEAAGVATMVKLMRVILLAPVILLAGLLMARSKQIVGRKRDTNFLTYIPWFVWGFIAMIALRSLGLLPILEFESSGSRIETKALFGSISKWLLAVSLAAIGLQIRLSSLIQRGNGTLRVLTTALLGWILLSSAALALGLWNNP